MTLTPRVVSGNDVMHIEGLSRSFGSRQLFSDIDMDLKRGEHVAVIGDNGTGKTTILKIINGLLDADAGTITLGTNVHIGYYDQDHHVLHMDKTLFDEISDEYPYLNQTEIRNTLAAFLFTGDDVYKRIGDLSGGERGRLSLAKLMLSEANFLILDEPTNHLDITSKEILEDALNSYEGTVLYVSHDRYFINRTASRILELKEKKLTGYLGNYDYYLEKKEASSKALPAWSVPSSGKDSAPSENKLDWQAKKEQQAKARKRENDLRKCEEAIAALEKRIAGVENDMLLPENTTNATKLQELAGNLEEMNGELLGLYEKWEELSV